MKSIATSKHVSNYSNGLHPLMPTVNLALNFSVAQAWVALDAKLCIQMTRHSARNVNLKNLNTLNLVLLDKQLF